MKKLLVLCLVAVAANIKAFGQAPVTFEILTPPCDSDGVLIAHYTGSLLGPFTYTWHVSGFDYYMSGDVVVHTSSSTDDTLLNYPGGFVHLFINGSGSGVDTEASYNATLPFTVTGAAIDSAFCPAPGNAEISIAAGTPPYTVNWYDNATHTLQATGNPVSLPAGGYDIAIIDAAGCQAQYFELPGFPLFNIVSVSGFSVSTTSTTASCNNGTATVTGATGTPPYTYLWSTGETTPVIDSLSGGYYYVDVTDSNGCTEPMVPVLINQSPAISAVITPTAATCTDSDGAVIAFPAGGALYLFMEQWRCHSIAERPCSRNIQCGGS